MFLCAREVTECPHLTQALLKVSVGDVVGRRCATGRSESRDFTL